LIKEKELRIAIFIRGLHNVMGGAEKQLLKIALALAKKGFFIKIITLDSQNPELFFDLSHENISIKFIGNIDPNQKADFFERIRRQIKLYKILRSEKFNVGIAFMTGAYFFSVIPCRITGTPIILSERNSPSMYYITRKSKYKSIIFLSMMLANSITIQFSRFKQNYPRYLQRKFITIPNQIDTIPKPVTTLRENFQFVFAGRLCYQKQILELIHAFNYHCQEYSRSKLLIYGDGELRQHTLELIENLRLRDRIMYLGSSKNIEEVLGNGDVLCIPSLWEGFPNVLGEAMAAGIPAIGYDDCDGVIDMIENEVNGWLVKSPRNQIEFGQKMTQVCNLTNIDNFRTAALEKSKEFESLAIYSQWEKLILRVMI
jgi:GalNAc-alpha-(1->4)-GalNAc-alpha-(1->3)-diNAcBac-PP-undecaprenol alpha-1,4-N-acetyl-D-galactosaminyltransferase